MKQRAPVEEEEGSSNRQLYRRFLQRRHVWEFSSEHSAERKAENIPRVVNKSACGGITGLFLKDFRTVRKSSSTFRENAPASNRSL